MTAYLADKIGISKPQAKSALDELNELVTRQLNGYMGVDAGNALAMCIQQQAMQRPLSRREGGADILCDMDTLRPSESNAGFLAQMVIIWRLER